MNEEKKETVNTFNLEKKDKVAIVGCADSRKLAPVGSGHDWEFWGVNNLYLSMQAPWSRWFEIHTIDYNESLNQYFRRGEPLFRGSPVGKYLKELQALGIPVYMQRPWPIVPNAVQYPLNSVLQKFGNYFTNTISYMIALAMIEGFKTIGIWGVDMAVSSPLRQQNEYSHQRPSCEYFIGMARGMGIEVIVPNECDLLKTRFLYGFQEPQESIFSKKLNEMQKSMAMRQAQAEQAVRDNEAKVQQYIGARSALQETNKIWENCWEQ